MKRILFYVILCLGGVFSIQAQPVRLDYEDHSSTHQGGSKAPARPWYIDVTDNVVTTSATPCTYTLSLYDEDGFVVYSTIISEGTTQVILPDTLSGDFELRFEADSYYYYGYITL